LVGAVVWRRLRVGSCVTAVAWRQGGTVFDWKRKTRSLWSNGHYSSQFGNWVAVSIALGLRL
ncbi:MAG: hypothetical protein KDA59_09590, partial [Planctomycetales bacterium]|nr:hypothetical protein [Planctomycetales bacterium]